MSNPVIHFEIQVEDVARARMFYGDVFGWTFEDYSQYVDEEYWGVITKGGGAEGINGGLFKRKSKLGGSEPNFGVNAYVCSIVVEDFDAHHAKIISAGGKVVKAMHALTGMAWQGYYLDTEGNSFGLHQAAADAK